jgi:hypothetical protein
VDKKINLRITTFDLKSKKKYCQNKGIKIVIKNNIIPSLSTAEKAEGIKKTRRNTVCQKTIPPQKQL